MVDMCKKPEHILTLFPNKTKGKKEDAGSLNYGPAETHMTEKASNIEGEGCAMMTGVDESEIIVNFTASKLDGVSNLFAAIA